MTRTYALKRLLEHGPLTTRQICVITGWTSKQVHHAIDGMLESEVVVMLRGSRTKWHAYCLAD